MSSVGLNNVNNVAFKASNGVEEKSTKKEQEKNAAKEPYKTHAGLITGSVVGAVTGGINLMTSTKSALISLASYAAIGAAVDAITNNKRENFEKETSGKDKKEILQTNDNAELSRTGEVYHKTNVGKTYGTAIGAITLPLLQELQLSNVGLKLGEGAGIFRVASAITGALGGLALGAISDHFANNGAKKHADKADITA